MGGGKCFGEVYLLGTGGDLKEAEEDLVGLKGGGVGSQLLVDEVGGCGVIKNCIL